MSDQHFDVVVIGAGPAGEGAAINAAKNGSRVAIVDDKQTVGGNCTHWATIPSKALRYSVKQIINFNTNPMFRDIGEPRWFSFPRVLQNAEWVRDKQVKLRTGFYARNRVERFHGKARFQDQNQLEIHSEEMGDQLLTADSFIIATGSSPYLPPDVDFSHDRIYNSDSILTLSHTPRTLTIYGAGVIGCEYASIFCGLGVKVDLINPGSRLLSFLDDEISDALSYHLRNHGVLVRHNEKYASVEGDNHGVVLNLESGKKVRSDAFLWCNGRSGNTGSLGLDNVGLEVNYRGQLAVDRALPDPSAKHLRRWRCDRVAGARQRGL
jgi:Pyruvate/2-oxoglutarate dehydrogenase complex, dihydrolipoamide dehydrogenase (E3) component, and related enzymes